MSTIYHSAFGGDLVFEENESLEHGNKNPGMFGLKDTGRDKYTSNKKTLQSRIDEVFAAAKNDATAHLKSITIKEYNDAGGDKADWLKVSYEIPAFNYKSTIFRD